VGALVELEAGAELGLDAGAGAGTDDVVVPLVLPFEGALLEGVLTVGLVEIGRVRKITTRITVTARTASTVATAI
jgi:hypothetical protein